MFRRSEYTRPRHKLPLSSTVSHCLPLSGTRLSLPYTSTPIPSGFHGDLKDALDVDINYQPPLEFQVAAGSTYVGGKMLAKLGRIALVSKW